MKRRSHYHDYSRSGLYHITICTAKALHQPLGQIAGRLDKPDGDNDAPHVVLSPLGRMVEQELKRQLPVVCHRKDARWQDQQLQRCLEAADGGAVMVSARIAQREQAMMAAVQEKGYPVVIIADYGFPEIYHPSEEMQDLCAAGRLLLLSP